LCKVFFIYRPTLSADSGDDQILALSRYFFVILTSAD
jgi:hypothetical protein